ncbi:unannotated protein [freshwater metagenome]|uniref:Unannotated protein n=1 Tax=freshwater metagenome TaxID=449393 RepID=A0A6J7JBY5_9ZZZZ
MRAVLVERTLCLREPLRTAQGEMTERPLFLLELQDGEGRRAAGEAAPLEHYDGVSAERCRTALEAYLPLLRAHDGGTGVSLLDACRAVDPLPQALSAIDTALWSLAAQREGRPICDLLSDEALSHVPVNATIGATDARAAAAQALAFIEAGFTCLKVKVGVGDDASRLAAIRAAVGPQVVLRLDANGAWTADQAVHAIGRLAAAGLELVEEPVHGVDALREVRRRVPSRIAMDETAAEPGAIGSGAADAVCLKLARAGGISGLLAQAALVRASGAEVYLASTLDGPVGIAAALHCAAALRVELPCGLATLGLFEDAVPAALTPSAGAIAVPTAPGLGL